MVSIFTSEWMFSSFSFELKIRKFQTITQTFTHTHKHSPFVSYVYTHIQKSLWHTRANVKRTTVELYWPHRNQCTHSQFPLKYMHTLVFVWLHRDIRFASNYVIKTFWTTAPPISMWMVSPQRLFVHSFADTHTNALTPFAHINMVILIQKTSQTHEQETSKGNIDHFRISFPFNFRGRQFNTVNCFMHLCFILTEWKMNRFNIWTIRWNELWPYLNQTSNTNIMQNVPVERTWKHWYTIDCEIVVCLCICLKIFEWL